MIVVDTSALIAILLDEPEGQDCRTVVEAADEVRMSAGTLAEMLLVAIRRDFFEEANAFVELQGIEVDPLSTDDARRVAQANARWGKGVHPAGLNFGDCFAYALARKHECPLLFVGNDFSKTDVARAD